MPRIQPLKGQQITPDIAAAFTQHETEHRSRITNMKATMGRSVLAFKIYMQWYDLYKQVQTITGGRTAYLFAHAISSGSNCPLCTTYFRKLIIDHGENPASLQLTAKEQALLDLGSSMAVNNGEVSDEVYNHAAQYYNETDMVTLVAFAGQMIATNIFSNTFQVNIDDYLAPYVSINIK